MAHDVDALGDSEGDGELLLDEQHGDALAADVANDLGDHLDDLRRQALRRLVDQDHARVAEQRAANGQHLLLAAREHARLGLAALPEMGKVGVHLIRCPQGRTGPRGLHADAHVLVDRQVGEDLALLGHIGEAGARDPERPAPREIDAVQPHGARARSDQAHDRLQRRRSARAIAPEQADDLARPDREVHAVQDVALVVVGVQILDLEQRGHATSSPR
jgi:hypothetical protein